MERGADDPSRRRRPDRGYRTIAAGGSSGGSKSDGAAGTGDEPGGSDNPGGGEGEVVNEVDPSYFQTDEYKQGNFLSQIGAAEAYARFYGETESGDLASQLERVAVGVVDSGVYGAHAEFGATDVSGVNTTTVPVPKAETLPTAGSGRLNIRSADRVIKTLLI